jgi:hypothetical protein
MLNSERPASADLEAMTAMLDGKRDGLASDIDRTATVGSGFGCQIRTSSF